MTPTRSPTMLDTLIRFHCPTCNKRLKAGPEAIGRRAKCTRCGNPVRVPAEPEARSEGDAGGLLWARDSDPVRQVRQDQNPVATDNPWRQASRPAGESDRPGGLSQQQDHDEPDYEVVVVGAAGPPAPVTPKAHGRTAVGFPTAEPADPTTNPLDHLDLSAHNGVQAANILAEVQKALPETESAYQPSGRLPAAGLLYLLAGAGVGAVAAGVVRTVLIVVGVFAVLFLAAVVANMNGFLAVIGAVVLVVGALAYFGFAYFAAGAATAYTVRLFGRLGRSRSPGVEALVSATAAGVAIVGIWWAGSVYLADSPPEPGDLSPDTMQTVAAIEAFVGGLIAVLSAALVSPGLVRKAKFCEPCESPMGRRTAKSLPLADLYPIANHLKARDLDGFREAVTGSADGAGGKVEVFTCPCCRGGYVELLARCEFAWREGNNTKRLKKEWLVESAHLPADELAAAGG